MTIVTGTVPGWGGGTYVITFAGQQGVSYLSNGVDFPRSFSGVLGANGTLAVTLTDNLSIQPPGSRWKFHIVAPNALPLFDSWITISGPVQDVSATLQAVAPPLGKILQNPMPGTVSIRHYPPDASVADSAEVPLRIVATQQQQLPLAAFTDYQGYLGLAITTSGLIFPDGTVQTSGAGASGLWAPVTMVGNMIAPTDNTAHHSGLLSVPSGMLIDLSASTGETLLEVI